MTIEELKELGWEFHDPYGWSYNERIVCATNGIMRTQVIGTSDGHALNECIQAVNESVSLSTDILHDMLKKAGWEMTATVSGYTATKGHITISSNHPRIAKVMCLEAVRRYYR